MENLENLEQAVNLFYNSQSSEQAKLNDYLSTQQRDKAAWSWVWGFLDFSKSMEVQFFGAITLHQKLAKNWQEVPKSMRDELKEKILQKIVEFGGSGTRLVLNRLCMSLSAFIVHMVKEWPSAITDVITMFGNEQLPNLTQHTQHYILFDVLSGIPDEACTVFTSAQKASLRLEVYKSCPQVLKTVENFVNARCEKQTLDDEDIQILQNVSKCAMIWFKQGNVPIDQSLFVTNSLLQLVSKVYWSVLDSDGCLSPDESELAETTLKALTNMMVQPDSHKYGNTAMTLLKMFLDSFGPICKNEWKLDNLNEDIVFCIYSLLITSIECHSRTVLQGIYSDSPYHEVYMMIVNEILLCTDKPGIYPVEESCSTLTMGFWFMLQDEVLATGAADTRAKGTDAIGPIYSHLVRILIRKSKLPDARNVAKWNSDDLETFRCYRQDIADTLLCCFDVLNTGILKILLESLDEGIRAIQVSPDNWTVLEAAIHGFCAIAQSIESNEYEEIVRMMQVLNEIPYDTMNEKLLGTALETMGAYSEWVNDNPKYLHNAITLLVKGLDSSMSSQATLGLKDLTTDCHPEQMFQYAEPLLEACRQSMIKGHLANPESIRLMYSMGNLMSMIAPEKIPDYLNSIILPCFTELEMFADQQNQTDGARLRIIFCLNMIATLFSSLNVNKSKQIQPMIVSDQPQPILLILQKTMPIFKKVSVLYMNDTQVIEVLCKALQQALNNLMDDIKPILSELCGLILSIFQNKCVPPAIDIAGSCILMFFGDVEYKEPMRQMLLQIIIYSFNVFEQTPANKFSDISDILESFYALNTKITKKIPTAYYAQENMDFVKLIGYALKGITLPETGVIKKAASFIATFVKESRNHINMTNLILMKGEEIIQTVLLCIAGITPRVNVDVFGDILLALNAKYPAEFAVWMKMLETPSFPTSFVAQEEKVTFMKNIVKEKVNKRLVNDYIKRFAAKCRGLIETSDM